MNRLAGFLLAALAFALLLTALPAAAQECEPKTWLNPNAPGSTKVEAWEIDGRADAWWCQVPAPAGAAPGSTWWKAYATGGLYVLGWDAVKAAAPRVLAASNPWAQFQAERASIAAAVSVTPAQTCRRSQIVHAACVSLYAAQLPGYPGGTRADALAPGKCGAEPVCTAPPAWVVDAPTAADGTRPAYKLTAGVRSETSTGRATSGQPCKPEVAQAPSLVAGKVFAAYGPTFAAGMVALCRKP